MFIQKQKGLSFLKRGSALAVLVHFVGSYLGEGGGGRVEKRGKHIFSEQDLNPQICGELVREI